MDPRILDAKGREIRVGDRVRHVSRREQRRRPEGGRVREIRRLVLVRWPHMGDEGWYRADSLQLLDDRRRQPNAELRERLEGRRPKEKTMPAEPATKRERCLFCTRERATEADWEHPAMENDEPHAELDALCWDYEGGTDNCLGHMLEVGRPGSLEDALPYVDRLTSLQAGLKAEVERLRAITDPEGMLSHPVEVQADYTADRLEALLDKGQPARDCLIPDCGCALRHPYAPNAVMGDGSGETLPEFLPAEEREADGGWPAKAQEPDQGSENLLRESEGEAG